MCSNFTSLYTTSLKIWYVILKPQHRGDGINLSLWSKGSPAGSIPFVTSKYCTTSLSTTIFWIFSWILLNGILVFIYLWMDYIKGYCWMEIWSKTSNWVQLVVNMQHQLHYHALKSPLTSCYLSLEPLTMWYSHITTKYQFHTKYHGLVHIFPALVSTIMPFSKSIWVSKQEIRDKRLERKPWSQCFKGGWVPEIAQFGTLHCKIFIPLQQQHLKFWKLSQIQGILPALPPIIIFFHYVRYLICTTSIELAWPTTGLVTVCRIDRNGTVIYLHHLFLGFCLPSQS